MSWVGFLIVLAHLGVGALWLGSMAYSLFVVQPRVARVLVDPVRAEDVYRELGAGNRWRVIGLITVLAASGVILLFVHSGRYASGYVDSGHTDGGRSWGWWLVIGVKAGLLVAASGLFWWVSWRGWPLRVFSLPAEIPAVQARFRRVALVMVALIGGAFVLGVAAAQSH